MNFFGKIILFLFLSYMAVNATIYYVSPKGSDASNGTLSAPFATWGKAQTLVSSGDTVYFREGTYVYTDATTSCSGQTSTVNVISLNQSGTPGKLIHYFAYPGEKPVFDFYGMTCDCRMRAIDVSGNWIHLKGLEVKGLPQNNNLNHENWGVFITGSHNIIEQLNIHHIMGAGLFIQTGEDNLVLNCDSHENFDKFTSNGAGESADGFGCHTTTVGTVGNTFRGCRSWWNADDGFDCINCSSPVLVDSCWNWLNGYLPGTLTASGNGNGFKVGGYGFPPVKYPSVIPVYTVKNCLAFFNRSAGFYQNHHLVANNYYNNTAYNNKSAGFNLLGYTISDSSDLNMGKLRNNIAFEKTAVANGTGGLVDALNNSWNISSITVSNSDFQSIDTTGIYGARKTNGSLPDLKFLHLASGSKLIDKGVNVGIPYAGSAPDLGAYETGLTDVKMGFSERLNILNCSSISPMQMFTITGKYLPVKVNNNYNGLYLVRSGASQKLKVVNVK